VLRGRRDVADHRSVLLSPRACQTLPSMAWSQLDVDQGGSAVSIVPSLAENRPRAVIESGEPRRLRL
jgi:hypothetical protein